VQTDRTIEYTSRHGFESGDGQRRALEVIALEKRRYWAISKRELLKEVQRVKSNQEKKASILTHRIQAVLYWKGSGDVWTRKFKVSLKGAVIGCGPETVNHEHLPKHRCLLLPL